MMCSFSCLIILWGVISLVGTSNGDVSSQTTAAGTLSSGDIAPTRRTEHVCTGKTIIENVTSFDQLQNCTVIEGNLEIRMIHARRQDYDFINFPELVEITGYLLLYRVSGLQTLAHMFPNLAVVRGRTRFFNYALIVFEMFDFQTIGLKQLTTIEHGAVRFEKNPALCYLNKIDWNVIAIDRKVENIFIDNKAERDCVNVCPDGCATRGDNYQEGSLCWDSENCQRVPECGCSGVSCNGDKCCHPACVGGCRGPTHRDCVACRNIFSKGECVSKCPDGWYEFDERRCITELECTTLDVETPLENRTYYKLFDGNGKKECLKECPPGYQGVEEAVHQCVKCDKVCPTVCRLNRVIIDSTSTAKVLKGCTEVFADITISISNGENIAAVLDDSLGSIEVVFGSVKVTSSNALLSLSFFKKLRRIKGDGKSKYVFTVFNNKNIEEIWNVATHPNLVIENGLVFMHYNRKLCLHKIDAFFTRLNTSQIRNEKDISNMTNGDEGTCVISELSLRVLLIWMDTVLLQWSRYQPALTDDRRLVSYLIHYMEAPYKTITINNKKDVCSDNVWKVKVKKPLDILDKSEVEQELLQGLKPFTQYAVYVRTLTTNTKVGISDLEYVLTATTAPTNPRSLSSTASHQNSLKLSWKPPMAPNGIVTHYKVLYKPQNFNIKEYEKRNYCKRPLRVEPVKTEQKLETKRNNHTRHGGLCCSESACKKYNIYSTSQQEQLDRIKFENYIHMKVFSKRNNNHAISGREKREAPSIGSSILDSTLRDTVKITSLDNSTSSPYNISYSKEPAPTYQEVLVYNTQQTVLSDLQHFTYYNIKIMACQNKSGCGDKCCSKETTTTYQTLPSLIADNIHNLTIKHEEESDVLITWPAPPNPNGLILLYELEYNKQNDLNRSVCITTVKYRELGGYRLTALQPGKYFLRVRATSLAGNGSWTGYKLAHVGAGTWTPAMIGILVGALLLLIIGCVAGVVIYFKRREPRIPSSMMYASVNADYWGGECVYVKDEWEVDRDKVNFLHELGQGSFGMVYEGCACDLDTFPEGCTEMHVAVKTVNERASVRDRIEFLNEASVMKSFNCFHVVRLLGVVSEGQPTLVIMELMHQGDLKNYLRMHRPDEPDNAGRQPPNLAQTLQMAAEIADGMAYLAAKKFVHRDLAARNCMVDEHNTVKIGDFGMTRDVYETDYYRKGGRGMLPVRWMSPESLKDGVFTCPSDVWSYGVVLWEMATLAAQPYQGLSNEQVLKYVVDGGTMDIPDGCHQRLYDLMSLTWQYYPKQRPTFQGILAILEPDVDESFREMSYYHSEENQADLAHEIEKDSHMENSDHRKQLTDSLQPVESLDLCPCGNKNSLDDLQSFHTEGCRWSIPHASSGADQSYAEDNLSTGNNSASQHGSTPSSSPSGFRTNWFMNGHTQRHSDMPNSSSC